MRLTAVFTLLLLLSFLTDCQSTAPISSNTKVVSVTSTASPTSDSSLFLSMYVFPASIDPTKRYMFYLHGKIIEDQGIPAISSEYGEYEYEVILEKLTSHGFTMISEQRQKNTDGMKYAEELFTFSEGKIAQHEELMLNIGTGHGILYKPLDGWILPVVKWAG